MTEAQAVPKSPDSSLKTRIRTALVLAPAVLAVLYFGGGIFSMMMAVAGAIGVYEWARMVLTGQVYNLHLLSMTCAVAALGVLAGAMLGNPLTAFILLMALSFMIFAYNFSQKGPPLRLMIFGLLYIGLSCQIMVWLRNGTEHGLYHMLTLLLIVWGSDIFAYITGKTIGGPKLAPKISPKKTWAGFIGSSIGAGAAAAVLAAPPLVQKFGVETLGDAGYPGYFIMGFILAMAGQAGDLFISMFKRRYGIKDTGTILPGHGGILDRIDALLLVAIVFGLIARITGA